MQTQSREKAIFGKRSMKGRKDSWKEKSTRVREACEARMQGRPNDARVRVFAMYCNG
jgi:hypothetical protein